MCNIQYTKNLKRFINTFNYPDPSWDKLPNDFPNCDTSGLTAHEEGLFSGISLIWYANYGGRPDLYKRFAKSMTLLMIIAVSGMILKNILVSDMFGRVVEVNAATVSGTLRAMTPKVSEKDYLGPSNFLESTMSGLLRRPAN